MPHLKNLTVEFVSLVDRAAVRDPANPTEPQRFLLWKSDSGRTNTDSPEGGSMSPEELTAALQKAEQERDEALERAEKAEKKLAKSKKDEKPAEINKAELSPEVREALEKAERQAQEANERIAKAEEIAKQEREIRVTREFVTKAETEFPLVGGNPEEFGPVLKSASEKLEKDEYDALVTRLRAANEQVRVSNLLKEAGVGGDPVPSTAGSSEVAQIAEKAEALRKADPSLSNYEAMDLAMRQDREAQAAYLASVR